MGMNSGITDLKGFLDEKYHLYNRSYFIDTDPISIPHKFTRKEDIEIAGFLAATIAWGNRKSIITNANRLMQMMDNDPYAYIIGAGKSDLKPFIHFVHRTFNGEDCTFFISALKNIYIHHNGLEGAFLSSIKPGDTDMANAITGFRQLFLAGGELSRTAKHVSNPATGSSAKRLCMFLRWMVRKDEYGVDFGIWPSSKEWKRANTAILSCPLDVHSGGVARKLGILHRKQNDWKAVDELTTALKQFDPTDPVKYDFALFGLGAFEKF